MLPFLGDGALPGGNCQVLAVGNPTGDLPQAEREAQYVAALFGTKALVGSEATENVVRDRLRGRDLLHFATHAHLVEHAPLASGLRLAHGEELSLYELMGLRVDAALAVLSACETGRGEATGGDDVVGLARGILATGARATVVSLWRVDDTATSLIMRRFYEELRAGKAAADALAAAQGWLRGLDPHGVAQATADLDAAVRPRFRRRHGWRDEPRPSRRRATTGTRISGRRSSLLAGESSRAPRRAGGTTETANSAKVPETAVGKAVEPLSAGGSRPPVASLGDPVRGRHASCPFPEPPRGRPHY